MPDDDEVTSRSSGDGPAAAEGAGRAPRFLIPPGYPQVISIDFNTLLNHGHVTPEVLEHMTGLLAALQDSFRTAVPRRPAAAQMPAPPPDDGNECPDLGQSCPDVHLSDCPSDCGDLCAGHVVICSADDFTPVPCPPVCNDDFIPVPCPPVCIDDFGSCSSFDDLEPPECGSKIGKKKRADGHVDGGVDDE